MQTIFPMANCDSCPYKRNKKIIPKQRGISHKPIMVIMSSPTSSEVGTGIYASSSGGKALRATMEKVGFNTKDVMFTSAIKCVLKSASKRKDTDDAKAISSCRNQILAEIKAVNPELVIMVGSLAVKSIFGTDYSFRHFLGNVTYHDGFKDVKFMGCMSPAEMIQDPGVFWTFLRVMKNAKDAYDGVVKEAGETKFYVLKNEMDIRIAEISLKNKGKLLIGADIETTGLDFLRDRIINVGLSFEKNRVYVITGDLLNKARGLLTLPNARYAWHNGKFDVRMLRSHGFDSSLDEDTQTMDYVFNETGGYRDLGTLSMLELGASEYKRKANAVIKSTGFQDSDFIANERVAIDADYTRQIAEIYINRIMSKKRYIKLYYGIIMPVSRFLLEVEDYGFYAFSDKLEALDSELEIALNELEDKIQEAVAPYWNPYLYMKQAGRKSASGTVRYPNGMSFTSPYQLKWLIYTALGLKTKSRSKDTQKDTLEAIPNRPEFIDMILEYRSLAKDKNTYVAGIKRMQTTDGYTHTTFNVSTAKTGRLSSTEPNIQNIKRIMKKVFGAPLGRILLEADYKTAELRILGHIANEPVFKNAFINRRDLHQDMADKAGCSRQEAKPLNFGIPYGRQEDSVSEELGVSKEVARQLIKAWLDGVPEIANYLKQCEIDALAGKSLLTYTGRARRFGFICNLNKDGVKNEAKNFRIQSICNDMNIVSAMKIHYNFKYNKKYEICKGFVVNMVHDSIMPEVVDSVESVRLASELINDVMLRVPVMQFNTTVPMEVDVSVCDHWKKKQIVMMYGEWGFEEKIDGKDVFVRTNYIPYTNREMIGECDLYEREV